MAEYVTKEQVKEEILSWARCINNPERLVTEDTLYVIDALPAADVRPVVGAHWEEYEFMGERAYRCSNCKCMAPASWSLDGSYDLEGQFCDSCGADMRERKKVADQSSATSATHSEP